MSFLICIVVMRPTSVARWDLRSVAAGGRRRWGANTVAVEKSRKSGRPPEDFSGTAKRLSEGKITRRSRGSNPVPATRKKTCRLTSLFSVIFACGKLYCYAVIFSLRREVLCFAQFKGKYNITANGVCNNTFTE